MVEARESDGHVGFGHLGLQLEGTLGRGHGLPGDPVGGLGGLGREPESVARLGERHPGPGKSWIERHRRLEMLRGPAARGLGVGGQLGEPGMAGIVFRRVAAQSEDMGDRRKARQELADTPKDLLAARQLCRGKGQEHDRLALDLIAEDVQATLLVVEPQIGKKIADRKLLLIGGAAGAVHVDLTSETRLNLAGR